MFERRDWVLHFHRLTKKDLKLLGKLGYAPITVMENLKLVVISAPKISWRPFRTFRRLTLFKFLKKLMPKLNHIDKDFEVKALLDVSTKQIGAQNVWIQTNGKPYKYGKGIKIAVIDTGIDRHHTDLANRIAEYKDFTGDGEKDISCHGTSTASCCAGNGNMSMGKYRGMACLATLYIAKALGDSGSGSAISITRAIDWAISQGVDIISMSLGAPARKGGDVLSHAARHACTEHGIIVVVAAGNDPSRIDTPGCEESVITVGAYDGKEDRGRVASFSGRGPTKDGIVKPDVISPGVKICMAKSKDSDAAQADNGYTIASGTSFSCPLVAGGIALLIAKKKISPQGVKSLLMDTAKSLGDSYSEFAQGKGLVDFEEAMSRVDEYK